MFRTVPLSIIRSFSLYTQQLYMSYRFADSLQTGSGWNTFHPDPACKLSANLYDIYLLLCVQWKTSDDGQRNCLKYVEVSFQIKNFEKLVQLVGSIVRNLARCTATWMSNFYVILHKLFKLNVWWCSFIQSFHSFIHLPTADIQIGDLKFQTEDIEKYYLMGCSAFPSCPEVWGSHSSAVEYSSLVGCCAVFTGHNWPASKTGILPLLSESSIQRKLINLSSVQCLECTVSPHYTVQCCLCICVLFILMPQPYWKLGYCFCMHIGRSKFWSSLPH